MMINFISRPTSWALATAMVLTLAATAPVLAKDPVLPVFKAANFAPLAPIDNPYWPLARSQKQRYHGSRVEDGETVEETSSQTFGGPGPEIMGVPVTIMIDEATDDGLLVERTRDYYAQDVDGNVWYMGEDVENFVYDADDKLVSKNSHSSWRAGVNGAKPGYQMPASPQPGQVYFQENAPADEAMDYAEVLSITETVKIGNKTYTNVLKTFEGSLSEPDLREFKYYAPGVGLIRSDDDLDKNLKNPVIVTTLQP